MGTTVGRFDGKEVGTFELRAEGVEVVGDEVNAAVGMAVGWGMGRELGIEVGIAVK